MKATIPVIYCDAEDGTCGEWTTDYYEAGAFAVNGVRTTPMPEGWAATPNPDEHLCPKHTGGDPS